MSDNKAQALAAKNRGNAAFQGNQVDQAIQEFSQAITLDPTDAVYWSNRSMCYASSNRFEEALKDAEECVRLKPDWSKAYSRKGLALFKLGRLEEAATTYEQGLASAGHDAQLQQSLDQVHAEMQRSHGPSQGQNPMAQLFGPNMWTTLAANPKTRDLITKPEVANKLKMLQTNPNLLTQFLGDPQMMVIISALLNLPEDMFAKAGQDEADIPMNESGHGHSHGHGDHDHSHGHGHDHGHNHSGHGHSHGPGQSCSGHHESKVSKPAMDVEVEEGAAEPAKELTEEEKAQLDKHNQAVAEKELGNQLFAKKNFDEALVHYDKAVELNPTDITFRNNRAAVFFYRKEYERVINECKEAIEVVKGHPQGYKQFSMVAKSWAWIGQAYMAQSMYAEAINAFDKSLIEDGTDKVRKLKKQCIESKKKLDQENYLSDELSEKHKDLGNEEFKNGQWKEAIKEFTEAIRRNPKNIKAYSNRILCYQKVMDWARALEDCEKCIQLDPSFIKAYMRKGKIQHLLKQYHKALETFNVGLSKDAHNEELIQARMATMQAIQMENSSGKVDPERAKEAMKDPEIVSILRDPTMNKVLEDLQSDPKSAQSALKDPNVAAKLEKLIAAGILRIG